MEGGVEFLLWVWWHLQNEGARRKTALSLEGIHSSLWLCGASMFCFYNQYTSCNTGLQAVLASPSFIFQFRAPDTRLPKGHSIFLSQFKTSPKIFHFTSAFSGPPWSPGTVLFVGLFVCLFVFRLQRSVQLYERERGREREIRGDNYFFNFNILSTARGHLRMMRGGGVRESHI